MFMLIKNFQNEKEGELTTSLYMYLSWEDSRLTWNRSDFDDINLIRIPPSSIWTPDVILTNTLFIYLLRLIIANK